MFPKLTQRGTAFLRCATKRDHPCPGARVLHVGMFATTRHGRTSMAHRVIWLDPTGRHAVLVPAADGQIDYSGKQRPAAVSVRQDDDGVWWEDGRVGPGHRTVLMGEGRQTFTCRPGHRFDGLSRLR